MNDHLALQTLPEKFISPMNNKIHCSTATNADHNNKISVGNNATWNFQVATWNVWFGLNGNGQPHPTLRMKAIVHELVQYSTDDNPLYFIGLQEMISELASIIIPELEQYGYTVYQQPTAGYGCAVAVNTKHLHVLEHKWHPYRDEITIMERGYYSVRATMIKNNTTTTVPDSSRISMKSSSSSSSAPALLFTTTHLESWIGNHYTGTKQRTRQILDLEQYCNNQLINSYSSETQIVAAIITGDLNWDDMSGTTSLDPDLCSTLHESNEWYDAWLVSNAESSLDDTTNNYSTPPRKSSKDYGYTYDQISNPMLSGKLQRRFDRCLARGSSSSSRRSSGTTMENDDDNNTTNCKRKRSCIEQRSSSSLVHILNATLLGKDVIPNATWERRNHDDNDDGMYIVTMPTLQSDHYGLLVQMQAVVS